jgi:uncharacterized repeat protein (TIGR03803 family)
MHVREEMSVKFDEQFPVLFRLQQLRESLAALISRRPSPVRRAWPLAFAALGVTLAGGPRAGATPTLTTLVNFDVSNGINSEAGLIADANGNLYGTTGSAGAGGYGTVFEVAAGTHACSTLATFNQSNGSYPSGGLVADAAGNLYGTTSQGGTSNLGTVFEVALGSHVVSTLVTFNSSNGTYPQGGLIADAAGNLFGTTITGGPLNGQGTVFQLTAATHTISTLATFRSSSGSGTGLFAGVITDSAGNLYGVTDTGGGQDGAGTVFEIAAQTHAISALAVFNTSNGAHPHGSLIADAAGNLYGTTDAGGPGPVGFGTVFEVSAGTHILSTLASFDLSTGNHPESGLVADAAGDLFGTTENGGANYDGTIFEVAAGTHALSTLLSFNGANGASPMDGLIADASGNLYGTTWSGGISGYGNVFELANDGFFVTAPEPSASWLIGLAAMGLLARRQGSRRACWR